MIVRHVFWVLSLLVFPVSAGELVLFDPGASSTRPQTVSVRGIAWKVENDEFVFENKKGDRWPSLVIKGEWSLRDFGTIELKLRNDSRSSVRVYCRLDSPGADPNRNRCTMCPHFELPPGKTETWRIAVPQLLPEHLAENLFGMRGYPGGAKGRRDGTIIGSDDFDPGRLRQITFFLGNPKERYRIGIQSIRAVSEPSFPISSRNEALTRPANRFFPMIDRYGQYRHASWPGKIKTEDDFKKFERWEQKDLEKHPGPKDRNRFGGWIKGPRLKATGKFRVEKVDGKWWFVDPEGRLFWSHGPCCIHHGVSTTNVSKREHYFEEFPVESCRVSWNENDANKSYNFAASNLRLKYGEEWKEKSVDLAFRRLKSWGMNTLANWSHADFYLREQMPFVVSFNTRAPLIEASKGSFRTFPDPFDPDFRQSAAEGAARLDEAMRSPMCLGVFVDNELNWGRDHVFLAHAVLKSPSAQAAKIAAVNLLKEKYRGIEQLNDQWKTTHASWNAFLECRDVPDRHLADDDLFAIHQLFAAHYFRTIREELKKISPQTLYLGCRFAHSTETTHRVASEYADVVSFNRYVKNNNDFHLENGIDRPILVGEFHFGALDRGLFHPGLQRADNQKQRGEFYEQYIRSSLENPQIVGAHWFQYGDQAATGRGQDGENYQIGFVDICDTPYPETINAVRNVGNALYEIRAGRIAKPAGERNFH